MRNPELEQFPSGPPGADSDRPGTLHVALDESFSPLLCVGATVADTEFSNVNSTITELYNELTGYSWLSDLESFRKFTRDGFHMSNDSTEISNRFTSFLAHSVGYNTFLYYSESKALSKNKTTLLLYRELVRTVLQKYRSRPLVKFYFEQNDELNRYFEPIVLHCRSTIRRPKPDVLVEIRPKMDPPLLAVCDYTMLTFARWYKGYANCAPRSQSRADFTWRNFNALRRSISLIRSPEGGNLSRRSLPFMDMLW